jgi:nicotinamidase-related amidase
MMTMTTQEVPLTLDDFLRPSQVALVMWDFQKGLAGKALHAPKVIAAAQELLAAAEKARVPVIWSRHILPPRHLMSGPFKLFMMKKQKVSHPDQLTPAMEEGMEDTQFVDGLAPAPHHIVIQKSQPSLFVDTPLDLRLKTLGVQTLVLAGVATDIGVEFTARHAADLHAQRQEWARVVAVFVQGAMWQFRDFPFKARCAPPPLVTAHWRLTRALRRVRAKATCCRHSSTCRRSSCATIPSRCPTS